MKEAFPEEPDHVTPDGSWCAEIQKRVPEAKAKKARTAQVAIGHVGLALKAQLEAAQAAAGTGSVSAVAPSGLRKKRRRV